MPTKNTTKHKNNGFTLIELLITTSLTVLLLLGISSLFMTFLISSAKTNTKKTVKEEGSQALSQIEFLLKNAHYIDETSTPCTSGMTSITAVSLDGGSTTFSTLADASDNNHDKIASNSSFLTSSSVNVSSALTFDCSGNTGNRQININFGLNKITPDGTLSQLFNSTVNIRN
jgi:Tfp pilus assembly protein PilW